MNTVRKWKEYFERKGLTVNLGKSKVMVSVGITKNGLPKCKVCPCDVCCLGVKANSVLCVQCGKWDHSRCDGLKRLTQSLQEHLHPRNM